MEMVAQTPCLTFCPVPHIAFLPIARPKLKPEPPAGPEWLHEIKFDGFRIQLHKRGREVRLSPPTARISPTASRRSLPPCCACR